MAKNRRMLSKPLVTEAPQETYWDKKQAFGMVAKDHWYGIMMALRGRDRQLTKEITEARKNMEHDDGSLVYRSVAHMLEIAEQMQRENKAIIEALTPAYEQLNK